MRIINEFPVKIFEREYEGKKYYKMGLSKKDINGKYVNGYIDCRFRNDADVDASKKIYLQDCWLDFYVKDKITKLYVFINKFEYVSDIVKQETSDAFVEFGQEVELTDEDLPF